MTPTILSKLRVEVRGEGRRPHLDLGPGDQAALEAAITLTPRDSAGIFKLQRGAVVKIARLTTGVQLATAQNMAWSLAPQGFTTHRTIKEDNTNNVLNILADFTFYFSFRAAI